MTDPHEARRKAAEEVMEAYQELCDAAGMPVEDEEDV